MVRMVHKEFIMMQSSTEAGGPFRTWGSLLLGICRRHVSHPHPCSLFNGHSVVSMVDMHILSTAGRSPTESVSRVRISEMLFSNSANVMEL